MIFYLLQARTQSQYFFVRKPDHGTQIWNCRKNCQSCISRCGQKLVDRYCEYKLMAIHFVTVLEL